MTAVEASRDIGSAGCCHLIGLDSVGLDVHDAVAVDFPGGGVPGEAGRAVVHVGETQIPRRH